MLISREPITRGGRSTLVRGAAALLVAPLVAALPVSLLLLLFDLPRLPDFAHPADLVRGLYGLALVLLRLTVPLGLPAWALLRALRRENALIYGLAGGTEGLLAAIWVCYAFGGGIHQNQFDLLAVSTATGLLVALLFWLIARAPPQ